MTSSLSPAGSTSWRWRSSPSCWPSPSASPTGRPKQVTSAKEFWAAGRGISGVQNGFAMAGDYLSASTFLGFAGLIFLYGLDGWVGLAAAGASFLPMVPAAGRAHAQRRQVHDGRRARLPAEGGTRPDGGRHGDAGRLVRLPRRADGRRGRAAAGARRDRLRAVGRADRRLHARLRRPRRDAGHDLGADHQGRPADDRGHRADDPAAGQGHLQPVRAVLARGRRVSRRRRPT